MTEPAEPCERCANRDPLDRLDHGHVPEDILAAAEREIPPLAASITTQLTDLAAHAAAHGQQEARSGLADKEMPPCLADHVGSLATTLFGLTRPEEHGSTITTTIELPLEVPEGLIEGLQKAVRDLADTLGQKS